MDLLEGDVIAGLIFVNDDGLIIEQNNTIIEPYFEYIKN
jgi:hypothetical protein